MNQFPENPKDAGLRGDRGEFCLKAARSAQRRVFTGAGRLAEMPKATSLPVAMPMRPDLLDLSSLREVTLHPSQLAHSPQLLRLHSVPESVQWCLASYSHG